MISDSEVCSLATNTNDKGGSMGQIEAISAGGMDWVRQEALRAARFTISEMGLPPEVVSAAVDQYEEMIGPAFRAYADTEVVQPKGMTDAEFTKALPLLYQVRGIARGEDWGRIQHLAKHLAFVIGAHYKYVYNGPG